MKNFVLATVVVGMLAGCGDKPRGPVEVLGKTYMLASAPTQLAFSSKDTVDVTDLSTNKHYEWKYTLQGDEMTLTMPWSNGRTRTFDLHRNGNDFSGDDLSMAPKSPADDARIAESKKAEQAHEALEARMSPKGAPSDKSAYTPSQSLSDENNVWYVWLTMARTADKQDDQTKLGVLARAWYGTSDSFARQAVKDKELARINAKLDSLKKLDYVAVSTAPQESDLVYINTMKGYDFDKKGFYVIGNLCTGGGAGGKSGVNYSFTVSQNDGPFCFLPLADEEAAKKIEALRSTSQSGSLRIAATVYAKVAGVNGASLELVPVGVDYTIYKRSYKPNTPDEQLAAVSYWPYKQ